MYNSLLILVSAFLFVDDLAVVPTTGAAGAPQAQRERQIGVAGRSLDTIARDLSDKAIEALNAARARGRDYPIDVYLAIGGFSGKALAFSQLAGDRRNENDLRVGARILIDEARTIDNLLSRAAGGRYEWRLLQDQLAALSEHFGLGYNPPRRGSGLDRSGPSGRFRWQGRVDGKDMLTVRGERINIRHLDNNPITEAAHEFVEPLPRQPVTVRLKKLAGRGMVEISEQPSARNGYAVTILIDDPEGGNDFYRFELDW